MRLAHLIMIAMLCIAIPSYGLAAVQGACTAGGEMGEPAAPEQADACCADMNAGGATSNKLCVGGVCGSAGNCYTIYLFSPATDLGLYIRPAPHPDPSPALRIAASDPSRFWRPPRSL